MSTISLEGLQSFNANIIPPEERALAHIKVTLDIGIYDWQIFIPKNTTNLDTYLTSVLPSIEQDIRSKETQWQNLNPKTRTITDPITNQETIVPIQKQEIVKPDIPDYSTLRRMEYPSIYDQLDALWKGPSSQDYQIVNSIINAIKTKYTKP